MEHTARIIITTNISSNIYLERRAILHVGKAVRSISSLKRGKHQHSCEENTKLEAEHQKFRSILSVSLLLPILHFMLSLSLPFLL